MWGFEHYGIVPDLATFGKGISSSLPLAAVAGRPDVMDLHPAGSMTSTHTGNPVCCAAALASIDLDRERRSRGKCARNGRAAARSGCRHIKARFPQIGSVDRQRPGGGRCLRDSRHERSPTATWRGKSCGAASKRAC